MKRLLVLVLSLVFLVSCSSENNYEKSNFFAMDTFAEIRIYNDVVDVKATAKSAQRVIENIEKSISKTFEDSPVYKINSLTEIADLADKSLLELLTLSMELAEITDGYFEPLSGGLVALWEKCESEQRLPTEIEISEQLSNIRTTELRKNDNGSLYKNGQAMLDFGAIGKGYAADKAVDDLKSNGVEVGMLSFVSTVSVFGERDFKIAVRTPDTSGDIAGYITMRNEALAVSGDYERFYTINGEKYNHIVDPHSGYPASNGIHSVAVVCESAAAADALSTAIFAMGAEKAMELYSSGLIEFEALMITDKEIIVTAGMAEKFELASVKYNLAEI